MPPSRMIFIDDGNGVLEVEQSLGGRSPTGGPLRPLFGRICHITTDRPQLDPVISSVLRDE